MDLLLAMGWKSTSTVKAGTICAVDGSEPWGHIVIGVGSEIVDAHNRAHKHTSIWNYNIRLCLDPK